MIAKVAREYREPDRRLMTVFYCTDRHERPLTTDGTLLFGCDHNVDHECHVTFATGVISALDKHFSSSSFKRLASFVDAER